MVIATFIALSGLTAYSASARWTATRCSVSVLPGSLSMYRTPLLRQAAARSGLSTLSTRMTRLPSARSLFASRKAGRPAPHTTSCPADLRMRSSRRCELSTVKTAEMMAYAVTAGAANLATCSAGG